VSGALQEHPSLLGKKKRVTVLPNRNPQISRIDADKERKDRPISGQWRPLLRRAVN